MDEGDQKVQTSNYKISPREAMYSMVTIVNNAVVYLKVTKRIGLKTLLITEKNVTMRGDKY